RCWKQRSRNARDGSRGRPRYQLGETAQVLCNGREGELILGTAWAAQPKPTKSQDAFEVGEQHLDPFAIAARLLEGLGFAEGTSNVAGLLVDAARNLPRRLLRAASHLERAHTTIERTRPVEQLLVIHDLARGGERLAGGTGVDVTRLVEREVFSRKNAILTLGFIDDGNVRGDLLLANDPVEHRGRPIGGVGCKPFGLQAKAL